ncbi:MAG: cytochrome c3 family protein, partial [Burkholderiaceae bacterium]
MESLYPPWRRWLRSGTGCALAGLMGLLIGAAPAASAPLADRHQARGVGCEACHKTPAPTTAPASSKLATQQCLSCHESYEKLA